LRKQYPGFENPRDEQLREKMEEEVKAHFPDHEGYDISYEIIEGSPRKEMLRWAHVKNIDLLIVGRKNRLEGSGIVPRQLARGVYCSVLFVPENVDMRLRRMVVPTDFSDFSSIALESAIDIARCDKDCRVYTQYIYTVPYGYYRTGKTEAQFAHIMKSYAEERYQKFIEGIDNKGMEIVPVFSYDHDKKSPAFMIYDLAREKDADMIVIGPRGRNALTSILLGSVTEKLITLNSDVPMLIAKNKDKGPKFFDLVELIEKI
jgi:nucleotide-binding universal stress UspA family protein